MRITTFGARASWCQLPRIDQGFVALGHELVTENPDIIYANDGGGYREALALKTRSLTGKPAKLVLNVLDCAEINDDWNYVAQNDFLSRADAITVISPYVQSQLHRLFGFANTVIWNPVKPVSPERRLKGEKPYPYRAMMVGRLLDKGKRAALGIQGLVMAGFQSEEVAIVGDEYPGFGVRLGRVSDEMLSDLFCSVDYVLATSLFGGMELPPLEGMICGAVPIVCHDLTTFPDFYPRRWGCFPTPRSIAMRLRSLIDNPSLLARDRETALEMGEELAERLSGRAVAERLSGRAVAERIVAAATKGTL